MSKQMEARGGQQGESGVQNGNDGKSEVKDGKLAKAGEAILNEIVAAAQLSLADVKHFRANPNTDMGPEFFTD